MEWNESSDYSLGSAMPKYLWVLICRAHIIPLNIEYPKWQSMLPSQLFKKFRSHHCTLDLI